jgi:hypothetical protein
LTAGTPIENHREFEKLDRQLRFRRKPVWGKKIVPAPGIQLLDMEQPFRDHALQGLMGELDADPKLTCRRTIGERRVLLHLPQNLELVKFVLFEPGHVTPVVDAIVSNGNDSINAGEKQETEHL